MNFKNIEIYENIGIINADKIEKCILDDQIKNDISALVIIINDDVLCNADIDKIEESILAVPCFTIGVLYKKIGEKSLLLSSVMHIRTAIDGVELDNISFDNFRDKKILPLLNKKTGDNMDNFCDGEKNIDKLVEAGFISNIFKDLECDEFKKWIKKLFYNKEKKQLKAIKKCYDWYRNTIPKTYSRKILTMEESKQFCKLAVDKYKELKEKFVTDEKLEENNNIIQKNIHYEEKNRVGYLYLNAPHGNQMTSNFLEEFEQVCEKYILHSSIVGLIILGKGKHFSSGANVEQLIKSIGENAKLFEKIESFAPSWFVHVKEIFSIFSDMKIPVITGVSGFCIGSGLELALAGNIRLCEESSIIGFPESTFGLLPGATGTYRSTELVGMGNSLEMVLCGEFIDAQKAVELGLFHKLCKKKTIKTVCENEMEQILSKETYKSVKYIR